MLPALGGYSTVNVTFPGTASGAGGDGKQYSDSSMGLQSAHVLARPDPKSQASLYQPGTTATAFIVGSTGSTANLIVDVVLSFRVVESSAPLGTTNNPAGATAGQIYYRGLDGLAAAATAWPPTGVTQIG